MNWIRTKPRTEVKDVYYADRISNRLAETPEGYLICIGAPLCRTATKVPQYYKGTEVGLRTQNFVDVYREPKEVLSTKFLASLEGKPITDTHPPQFLDSRNAKWHVCGHAQNIRRGPETSDGEQTVIGDLVITDEELIQKIKSGVRGLSVGYQCEYFPKNDGSFVQRGLAANHIAVVESGRAGKDIRIFDSNGGNVNRSELAELGRFIKETIHKATRKAVQDALAERLPQRHVEVESLSTAFTANEHPSMEFMRKMRPIIEESNDPEAIANYNDLVRYYKRVGNSFVPVSDSTEQQPSRKAQKACIDFEDAVEKARKTQMAKYGKSEPEKFEMRGRAADSTSRSDAEEWGKEINRFGEMLREGKKPL